MKRRDFHRTALATAASCIAMPYAYGQNKQPIKLQVGFAPGGSSDAVARALAPRLATQLGQTVIVENRPGAGGRIAVTDLKRAPPDGTTLLLGPAGPFTIWPWLYPTAKLGYDPLKDYVQVASVAKMDFGVMINLKIPVVTDFKTLVDYLKNNSKERNYASPGPGTLPHFLGLMVGNSLSLPLRHVAYRGSGPAMNDFLGGQFPMLVDTLWVDRHRSKQLKIVATTGEHRYRELADVPTLRESGVDLVVDQYFLVSAPAGVPAETVKHIGEAIRESLKAQEQQDILYSIGQEPSYMESHQLGMMLAAQNKFWETPIKASGYVPD